MFDDFMMEDAIDIFYTEASSGNDQSPMFQKVFDKLQKFLPEKWKEVVFYTNYSTGSYSSKFYVKVGMREYIDCFSLPGVSKGQMVKLFMDIAKDVSSERNKLHGDKQWNTFTMIINSKGKMRTYFDYMNTDENMIEYERKWEKKYIKGRIKKK